MAKKDKKPDQEVVKTTDRKAETKKTKKNNKDKKPNIFVSLGRKLKETFGELKRVTWPTFGKALKATGVVIGIVLIFLILVTGVNFGFSKLLELLTDLGN